MPHQARGASLASHTTGLRVLTVDKGTGSVLRGHRAHPGLHNCPPPSLVHPQHWHSPGRASTTPKLAQLHSQNTQTGTAPLPGHPNWHSSMPRAPKLAQLQIQHPHWHSSMPRSPGSISLLRSPRGSSLPQFPPPWGRFPRGSCPARPLRAALEAPWQCPSARLARGRCPCPAGTGWAPKPLPVSSRDRAHSSACPGCTGCGSSLCPWQGRAQDGTGIPACRGWELFSHHPHPNPSSRRTTGHRGGCPHTAGDRPPQGPSLERRQTQFYSDSHLQPHKPSGFSSPFPGETPVMPRGKEREVPTPKHSSAPN
ncbi:uncharacterized protein LOC120499133 [Passer montanus]|uniref:uncharacterized protein LOC120499133 n=1 Tax=Passer montanus TaxID=9160 RepID=UPI001960FB61|nr:uncharacterized protein LOC120499133 [Passer montanus]